eukprot:4132549-Pleurochrysis_carterae.AAC.3
MTRVTEFYQIDIDDYFERTQCPRFIERTKIAPRYELEKLHDSVGVRLSGYVQQLPACSNSDVILKRLPNQGMSALAGLLKSGRYVQMPTADRLAALSRNGQYIERERPLKFQISKEKGPFIPHDDQR